MDILLVLGNVDPSQCELVLNEMKQHGIEPKIIIIEHDFSDESDLRKIAMRRMVRTLPVERRLQYITDSIEQQKRNILSDALGLAHLWDVKAVIRPADSYTTYGWLLQRLSVGCADHLVYIGEDGQMRIEGLYSPHQPIFSD